MLSLIFFSIILLNQLIPTASLPPVNQAAEDIQYPYSFGIKTTAKSILVLDLGGDKVVFQKNSQEILPLASLTKLMTALVFLESNPDLEKLIEIKPEDGSGAEEPSSLPAAKIDFQIGERVRLKDLLAVSLIKSANNAIKAIVRSTGVGQENFVGLMNERAKSLAMGKSFFMEPTGLSSGNYTTTEDLVKLIKIVFQNPLIQQLSQTKTYNFQSVLPDGQPKNYQVRNTNKLLGSFLKVIAGKTGYLNEAGYCFAGLLEYNKKKLIIVVLGSQSDADRFQEVKGLTWWASARAAR